MTTAKTLFLIICKYYCTVAHPGVSVVTFDNPVIQFNHGAIPQGTAD